MLENNETFVQSVYRVLLGRPADGESLRTAVHALNCGMKQQEFIASVITSEEFRLRVPVADVLAQHSDIDVIVPLSNGQRLCGPAADRLIMPTLLAERCWEPHLTRYLRRHLNPEEVFVDAGANLGYFTVLCGPLVRTVISFEPVEATHRYCQLNTWLNGLSNVRLFQYGLWNTDTTIAMKVDPLSLAGASISSQTTNTESVRCVTLDGMLASRELVLDSINWIKLDVEGAEPLALEGMSSTIEKFSPRLLVEVNPPALGKLGRSPRDIWAYFAARSYRLSAFKHWQPQDPTPVDTLDELERLCEPAGLVDVLAERR